MSLSREELEKLEQQNKAVHPPAPGPLPGDSSTEDSVISMPQGLNPVSGTKSVPAQLDLVAMRDRMIQSELLRLQRTLSRQNFRGAESARRLVRKLARKAEQNVAELESLLRSP